MEKSQWFEEKEVVINGINVNYKIAGQGVPFLILHGWGRGSDSWTEIQEKLAQAGFQVFVPDLPGFGKTPPPPAVWGIKEYAEFVLKFAEALKLNNFVLLGHSFGGQIAVQFAFQHPEKLKGIILCSAAVIRRKPKVKGRVLYFIAKIGTLFFSVWPLSIVQNTARKILYRLLGNNDYQYSQGIMKHIREKVIGEDVASVLQNIQVPTLIIWGDQDALTLIQDAYILKEKIPNSVLEVIPGVGHRPYNEAPERFFEIVLGFLKHL